LYVACLPPSERVIVPRLADTAAPPAPGVPPVITGGQASAHSAEQFDFPTSSPSHMYSARPAPSVR
jgi:hypothetical protein